MAEERCYFCRTGTLEHKRTTMTLHRGDRVIMIENVPATICDSCGEVIFAAEVVERAHELAEEILRTGKADRELIVPVGRMSA
ncbi:TPA: type II toxin-antitoxin system MqsA family antitoxin [Candidatus Bipolaricaulota bacterium]|nr:type II toxin-antitoxin system MqsA family antitoxin [Candidatus Bipolaricaulota bacterium]